jgi:hypothetical protein
MMALVALLLTHLAIFIPWSNRARVTLVVATFGSALGGEASSWLVRFGSPAWAPLKVACFLVLQLSLGILLVGLAAYLFLPSRRAPVILPEDDSPMDRTL